MAMRNRILGIFFSLATLAGLSWRCETARADAPDKADVRKPGFRLVRVFEGGKKDRMSFAFSPDGKLLATTHEGALRLWDVKSGREVRRTTFKETRVNRPIFVENGKAVVCAVMNDLFLLEIPSLKQRAVFHPITEGGDTLGGVEAHPEGSILVLGTTRYLMRLNLRSGKTKWRISFPCSDSQSLNSPSAIALSPDKRTVAVALSHDKSIRLLDMDTGKELRKLEEPPTNGLVIGMAFFPDGRTLAAGNSFAYQIGLWEPDTGRVSQFLSWCKMERPNPLTTGPKAMQEYYRNLRKHPGGVFRIAVSPDGKTVAAACMDNILRLWEISSGQLRHERKMDISRLQFTIDGRYLAINDHKVSLWNWRDAGSSRHGRLTKTELDQLWTDLAKQDAEVAHRAIARLGATPSQAMGLLGGRLRRVEPTGEAELKRLVADLNADDFQTRERASRRLEELGQAAEPRLRRTLEDSPTLETRRRIQRLLARLRAVPPEQLRFLRSVEILELVGNPESKRLLQRLSTGASGARETEDAAAALHRLEKSLAASP